MVRRGLLSGVMGTAFSVLVSGSGLPLGWVYVGCRGSERVRTGWLVGGLQPRLIRPYVLMRSV